MPDSESDDGEECGGDQINKSCSKDGTEAALGDVDQLGLDIWPAAVRLCEYLEENADLVFGKRVIELGAGVGLPCLLCSFLGAKAALISDYDARVVAHASANAFECGAGNVCQGLQLDWTRLEELNSSHKRAYDVILAADVLYISEIMPDFMKSIQHLLTPHGLVLIAHQNRRSLVMDDMGTPVVIERDVSFENFKQLCEEYGYSLRVLGQRDTPGFPGPMMVLAIARDPAKVAGLRNFQGMKEFMI